MMTPVFEVNEAHIRIVAQQLPASPRIFAKVQAALARESIGVADIVELVKVDSGLCSGLVRVANSPYYRRGESVESINEAINRLGMREVHRMLGLALSQQMTGHGLSCYRLSAERMWENSVVVALAAAGLAELAGVEPRAAYTLGLLRGVGMCVLQLVAEQEDLRKLPEGCDSGAETLAWERATFGATAATATAVLLRGWGFSTAMREAVLHQVDPAADPAAGALPAILHLANAVAERLDKGLPCETGNWQLSEAVAAQAGVRLDQVIDLIPDLHAEFMRLRTGLL